MLSCTIVHLITKLSIVTIPKIMPRLSYQTQFDTKKDNMNKILNALKDSPKRNKDLLKICKLSDSGLSKILKNMLKDGLIEHNPKTKEYSIVHTGLKILETADISSITNRIRNDDGMYYHNYSGVMQTIISRRAIGAVKPFMYIDKNLDTLNLFSTSDVEEIEKLVFKKLSSSIRRNRLIEKNAGDIVLGFIINYQKAEQLLRGKKK